MVNRGNETRFYGIVIAFLADTLAAHDIGGFKVGVGFALRKCRVCLATDDMIQTKVVVCISIHPIDSFYSLMNLISH